MHVTAMHPVRPMLLENLLMSSEIATTSTSTTTVSRRGLRVTALITAIVLVAIVVIGLITRVTQARSLKTWTETQAVPTVSVVSPERSTADAVLDLPGRMEAYTRAPIYAQVSGYLKNWNVDIGAPVKAGQLLAEIQTPEIDQQLLQARADLASTKANAELAGITAKRWQAMLGSDSVAQQDVDQRTGDYA